MNKIPYLFLVFILISHQLISQILPKEGSMLNYRLIGFSFPNEKDAANYKLEIALGHYESENLFVKNIIKSYSCLQKRIISEVPFWGMQYTWRIVSVSEHSANVKSELRHFNTILNPEMDTSMIRLRIIQQARAYKNAFVFFDANRALYDMNGRAVWFLPGKNDEVGTPADLKLSPQGTITFLQTNAYEVNYNGDILWKAPANQIVSGDSAEHYHHEFTRLANGHYMILGTEYKPWKQGLLNNATKEPGHKIPVSPFPTVIEYDEHGKVVWAWKSSDYFASLKIKFFNIEANPSPGVFDPHANSFYFDEKNTCVYVSFKNTNEILKIKYPERKVIDVYGKTYDAGDKKTGDTLFCGQHGISKSRKGYLCLFDNNSCNDTSASKVMLLQETEDKNDKLKKIWEYTCTTEEKYPQMSSKAGDVMELPDNSLFVCMGTPYSKAFIVNLDKEILWSAVPERWDVMEKKWYPIPQYRASMVFDNKALEKLIWNSAKTE